MKRDLSHFRLWCLAGCCLIGMLTCACVKLPRRVSAVTVQTHAPADTGTDAPTRISLNHATREELEKLPGIGPALAARIVEQRERFGPFRRAEHLIMVRGISDRRFRQMRASVSAE